MTEDAGLKGDEQRVLVKEIMSAPAVSIKAEEEIVVAVKKMNRFRIGSIVVINSNGQPIGIITERDILKVLERRLDLKNLKAKDVMTTPVHVTPDDFTVEAAANIMADKGIRRLPVVRGQHLVGLITSTDIVKAVAKGLLARKVYLYLSDIFRFLKYRP